MANNTELCVMVEGQLVRLLVEEEVALRAAKDPEFMGRLVHESMAQVPETEKENRNVGNSGEAAEKTLLWPDKAVFLLIEIYREKEPEFNSGFKRNNVLWAEIAKLINDKYTDYNLTGLQCSNKWSGLKRSYKNIFDENKKSGNCRNSWTFFSETL